MYKFLIVLVGFCLSGCVTDTPDKILGVGDAPLGVVKKVGDYPVINQAPAGQAEQFTAEEKAVLKSDTASAVQKAEQQAAQDNQAAYLDEVAAMKKLAVDQQKKRLDDIESRKYQQE